MVTKPVVRNAVRLFALALVILMLLPQPGAMARRKRIRRVIDLVPPVVQITTPTDGSSLLGDLTVDGSASDDFGLAGVEVTVDGGTPDAASGADAWTYPLSVAGLPPGAHEMTVTAVDTSGNRGVASVGFTVLQAEPGPWVTPEGATIEITSAGAWTYAQIDSFLRASDVDLDLLGPGLTIKVQDQYASQTVVSAAKTNGAYSSVRTTIYLKGVNSNFASKPDAIMAHEYGHAWSLYHFYLDQQGDWTSYLDARALTGDSRLDSSYTWDRKEIIAEDYRLLFGSPLAISQMPNHMNTMLQDPRQVVGLGEFLAGSWRGRP